MCNSLKLYLFRYLMYRNGYEIKFCNDNETAFLENHIKKLKHDFQDSRVAGSIYVLTVMRMLKKV